MYDNHVMSGYHEDEGIISALKHGTIVIGQLGLSECLQLLFGFDHASYVTFLPKSITTAIGMGVSQELGGYVSVTVVVIVLTGVIGNVIADRVLGFLHIEEPIAKGVAIGSASHAIGTARAMEMGQVEGAMSGLSIVVSGIMTVLVATVFSWFL